MESPLSIAEKHQTELAHHRVEALMRVWQGLGRCSTPLEGGGELTGDGKHARARVYAGDEAGRPHSRCGFPREDTGAARDIEHVLARLELSAGRHAGGPRSEERGNEKLLVRLGRRDPSRQLLLAHGIGVYARAGQEAF